MKNSLKLIGATMTTLAFASGTAFAGDGKNCDHKKKASMKTQASQTETAMTAASPQAVLAATEMKKAKKTYSFDDTLELCQKKGVENLQACIDYKTGKVSAKPKS